MIGTMLKPFFKKFAGLFVSMVFVSMLSIGLLTAFASTIYNLRTTFKQYLADYNDVDAVVTIPFTERATFDDIESVPGVEAVEYRVTMDSFLYKLTGRTITSRISTFKDDNSSLFGRYVLEQVPKSETAINLSVVRRFAANNGFKVGDTIKLGYLGLNLEFFINEIIESPEAIQARANNYVWSDNTDFGYVYIGESELNKAIYQLAKLIEDKITENDDFRQKYEKAVRAVGTTFPDLVNQVVEEGKYTTRYTNQLLIKAEPGYTQEEVVYQVKKYMQDKGVEVKSATENHNMFYYLYIEHAVQQLQVAAIFLPVFFYAVTMIVIGLFVNQIIKAMTPQIGIMMSIGAGKMDIISIFLVFSTIMSVVAGVLGTGVGILLNRMLAKTMISVYSMPTIPLSVNPWIAVLAVMALVVFALLATLLSCRQIMRITPKDATINNEAARKKLSPRLERVIERSPMNIKLALNSVAQNPRRFFVSVFSIFASFVIILLSLFFYVSKTELMNQTLERRLTFDAQVYMTTVATDELVQEVRSDPSVKEMLDCYYTYAEITNLDGSKSSYLECLAYDETAQNNLIKIPDRKAKGNIHIVREGLILPTTVCKALKVKVGDVVKVGGVPVRIAAESYQYFHPITYMSKWQMEQLGLQYVSSFVVDVNDESAFLAQMSQKNASLTVFTKSLSKDVHGTFDSINIFIYILIAFSLLMGLIILSIMSQNALMEQKRQISVFRAIGFTVLDISNLWTLQSVSQLLLSTVFAIPVGVGAAMILFKMCSSTTQIYPFIFNVPMVLFAFAFILVIIVVSHLISMFTIKRWNLADNTRSRE